LSEPPLSFAKVGRSTKSSFLKGYREPIVIRTTGQGVVARNSLAAVILGVIAASALVTASYATAVSKPAAVHVDGVELKITYLNGASPLFGPTEQNACYETVPLPIGDPTFGPECPSQIVAGSSYDLQFFVTGNPGDSPGLWANMTVAAPFSFQLFPAPSNHPTTYSNQSGLFQSNQSMLYDNGEWTSWALVFTFPVAPSSAPGGLWLDATLTIQTTNHTLY
jgi:hypothetical protein